MYELRVSEVHSVGQLRTALSPGRAGDHGDFEDGILRVEDRETAESLAERHNVELLGEVESDTCEHVIQSGENEGDVCGRELPCRFHD